MAWYRLIIHSVLQCIFTRSIVFVLFNKSVSYLPELRFPGTDTATKRRSYRIHNIQTFSAVH